MNKNCIKNLGRYAMKGIIPWNKGKKGAQIPWNKGVKGLFKHRENTKKYLSIIHKGKHHTLESKEKVRLANTGKKLSDITKTKISNSHKGIIFSEGHKRKLSITKKGNKNPAWKGGIVSVNMQIRNSLRYQKWRQNIFIKDNFICQKCKRRGGDLEVHHNKKSFFKLLEEAKTNLPLLVLYEAAMLYSPLWDISNGITLCKKCHNKTKRKEIGNE